MKWGFEFTDREGKKVQVINAKGETLPEKRMFKGLLKNKRCLIPANGFYEWKRTPSAKTPHYIKPVDSELFYFGGLFRAEKIGEREVLSCVIVTTAANQTVSHIHHRMPLIIEEQDMQNWLASKRVEDVTQFIKPAPDSIIDFYPVSKDVNKPINDDVGLIEKIS